MRCCLQCATSNLKSLLTPLDSTFLPLLDFSFRTASCCIWNLVFSRFYTGTTTTTTTISTTTTTQKPPPDCQDYATDQGPRAAKVSVGSCWKSSNLGREDATPGSSCYSAVRWAMKDGNLSASASSPVIDASCSIFPNLFNVCYWLVWGPPKQFEYQYTE